jgi:hypothetical protein
MGTAFLVHIKDRQSWAWWNMPVTPVIQEAEVEESQF